jgi:hypothetical protein
MSAHDIIIGNFQRGSTMKDIPNYENRYAVTTDGRVWSYRKETPVGKNGGVRIDGDKWLTLTVDNRGYHRIALVDENGKRKMWLVHRLVALTYISNPDSLPFINHINGNTTDNRIENLEWCDAKGNAVHAYGNGWVKIPNQSGEANSQSKLTVDEVKHIRLMSQQGKGDTEISRELNIGRSCVAGITKYRTWRSVA